MRGLVFWVEGPVGIAFELWQEPLHLLSEAISERLPVWLLRYYRSETTPAYEMEIWDSRGRTITFWGAWKSKKILHFVESYWQAEGFIPGVIVKVSAPLTSFLVRWKKRFRIPVVDFGSGEGLCRWPHSGLPRVHRAEAKRLLLPLNRSSSEAAHRIGSFLLERGWSVLFTGWAQESTSFRRLHSQYPHRVGIYLGLSWLDVESLLEGCWAVILPAPIPSLLGLGWGRPVFYPGALPWEGPGLYTYQGVEELLASLRGAQLTPTPLFSPAQLASRWIEWYESLLVGNPS